MPQLRAFVSFHPLLRAEAACARVVVLRQMDVNTHNLQAENLLLGAVIEDLRARCAKDDGPSQLPPAPTPPPAPAQAAPLRQTEDALLDMHQECKVARQALRRQTDVLQRTQALLSDAKRANVQQKQALAAEASGSGAAERSLVLEIAALEREAAGGAAARRLRTAAARAAELEATAHEAIEGMQAAQRECGRPAG